MRHCLSVALILLLLCPFAKGQGVQIAFGTQGVSALTYHGVNLLWSNPNDGTHGAYDGSVFWVQKVVLRRADGTTTTLDQGGPSQVVVDPAKKQVTRTFAWGTVRGDFSTRANRLTLRLTVTDTTPDTTLQAIYLQPLWLKFPQTPRGYDGSPRLAANLGTPSVIGADYGSGVLALCNDGVRRPLLIGFPYALDNPAHTTYPVLIASGSNGWLGGHLLDNRIVRPIAPGHADTYQVSLRFGPPGTPVSTLAAFLDTKMASEFPYRLAWPDRRPIGYLMLSSSVPHPASGKNPRGWFNNDPTIDVTTPAGRAAFRARLMQYADNSIRVLKTMHAQGAITWDIEGQQYPHATSYIGDPRLVKTLDPEMDPIADAYFQKFREAGLRVGVCIRPQVFHHATGQQNLTDPQQIEQTLLAKMLYANKRWGCTLFYVDSNGDPNVPDDPAIFEYVTSELARHGIHALVIPEQKSARYYAVTAPYAELRGGNLGTPKAIRRIYPQAFTVLCTSDGPLEADHQALVDSVRRGDILLFRAWWDDPQNAQVAQIEQDAHHEAGIKP